MEIRKKIYKYKFDSMWTNFQHVNWKNSERLPDVILNKEFWWPGKMDDFLPKIQKTISRIVRNYDFTNYVEEIKEMIQDLTLK